MWLALIPNMSSMRKIAIFGCNVLLEHEKGFSKIFQISCRGNKTIVITQSS